MTEAIDTDHAASLNREAWDSIRRQRDAGLIARNQDIAADLLAGRTARYPEQVELLGDVVGQRLLDLGCGDGKERLEWARRLNPPATCARFAAELQRRHGAPDASRAIRRRRR